MDRRPRFTPRRPSHDRGNSSPLAFAHAAGRHHLKAAPEPAKAASGNPVVVVDTSMGTIKIELFQDKAPITVKNFLAYVDDKHYDGTIFHRVIKENTDKQQDFMIQVGASTKK